MNLGAEEKTVFSSVPKFKFYFYLQQHLHFLSFFLLQKINISDNINNNPRITANTITAGNAANIAALTAAPIISPITTANDTNSIVATIPRQFFLLLHLSSLLS